MFSLKRDSLPTFCILSIEKELENSIRLQLTPFYELQAERMSREKGFNKSVKYETVFINFACRRIKHNWDYEYLIATPMNMEPAYCLSCQEIKLGWNVFQRVTACRSIVWIKGMTQNLAILIRLIQPTSFRIDF